MPKIEKQGVYQRTVTLILLMLFALILSYQFTPTHKMSEKRKSIDFEHLIPKKFSKWQLDEDGEDLLVDPEVKQTLESVYSQTVSRTYINDNGQRVMLSIAYGGDQEEVMQVHKPEVCYTAQGFSVTQKGTTAIKTDKGTVSANLLLAKQAERIESVTYWITIGKSIALNGLQWRWERIKYGLTGELPDGLLFRVSSLGLNTRMQYELHKLFIRDLMSGLSMIEAQHLTGQSVSLK